MAGLTTWTSPDGRPFSVIVAPDFGVTERALKAWDRYRSNVEPVEEVIVSFSGIDGIPCSERDLATFVALGGGGSGLALSGVSCGYGGEGPHGTAAILRSLGVGDAVVDLVFEQRDLRLVRLSGGGWMAEVRP